MPFTHTGASPRQIEIGRRAKRRVARRWSAWPTSLAEVRQAGVRPALCTLLCKVHSAGLTRCPPSRPGGRGSQRVPRDALVDEVLSEFGDRVGLLDAVQGGNSWRSLVLFQEMKESTIGSPWVQVLTDLDSGSLAEPEFGVHGQDEGHQSHRHNRVREFFQRYPSCRSTFPCSAVLVQIANWGLDFANRPAGRMGHCSTLRFGGRMSFRPLSFPLQPSKGASQCQSFFTCCCAPRCPGMPPWKLRCADQWQSAKGALWPPLEVSYGPPAHKMQILQEQALQKFCSKKQRVTLTVPIRLEPLGKKRYQVSLRSETRPFPGLVPGLPDTLYGEPTGIWAVLDLSDQEAPAPDKPNATIVLEPGAGKAKGGVAVYFKHGGKPDKYNPQNVDDSPLPEHLLRHRVLNLAQVGKKTCQNR